jgi:O-antigen ligase
VIRGRDYSGDDDALQRPLEHFRATTKRLRIHPAETGVLWLVCLHLVFISWAIGGMRPWAQFISLGLAIVGFGLALLPREYTEEHTGSRAFRLIMWPKLVRFPLFWIGLGLLGLVVVQGLNPSWTYETNGVAWWMRRIPHREWLPPGVEVPFERWGPWRMLIIFGSVWLTACTLWLAFTRRRTVQILFTVLAVNGILLAMLGIAQRLFPNGMMFWIWKPPASAFFSSFVYKNHAGSYLILSLAAACGLAAWHYVRGLRRLEKSNPSGVFVFIALFISIAILISFARGATLVMLVFLLLCVLGFVGYQFSVPSEYRKPVVAFAMVLVFGFFLKIGLDALQSGVAWSRLQQGLARQDMSMESREIATKASLEMLQEHWLKGTGAGSFKFLFPTYQQRHPAIYMAGNRLMFWEHAHNDLVQTPIEFGLAGMLLVLAGAAWLAYSLIRHYFWENPLSATVVLGLLLLLAYSWWDFPFQNPAILMTWCTCWVAVVLWSQFEELNLRS